MYSFAPRKYRIRDEVDLVVTPIQKERSLVDSNQKSLPKKVRQELLSTMKQYYCGIVKINLQFLEFHRRNALFRKRRKGDHYLFQHTQ